MSDEPRMSAEPRARVAGAPALVVVGCPRSGTTLLQRMLDHHPRLAVANDTHFIPRFAAPEVGDRALTPELVESVLAYRPFARLEVPAEDARALAASCGSYREWIGALYRAFARGRGKELAGEKTPDYVRYLTLLDTLLPWVKVLHIVRDGRDVALSLLDWAPRKGRGPARLALWREHPIAMCALWWEWQVRAGTREGLGLGAGRYREVRYEELVAEPERVLRGVAEFLELPFAPEMLRFHEGKRVPGAPTAGLSAKRAWLPPTPRLRDWRAQMAPADLDVFEAIAGDLLEERGFARAAPAVSSEARALAERSRVWWASELERRARKRRKSGRPRESGDPLERAAPAGDQNR